MVIGGFQTHPAADLFPLVEGREFDELVADIEKNGLLHPIVLHEGKILDGRNRARACKQLGIAIKNVKWDGKGESATAWVISTNLHRRHLTPSQAALIAAEALPLFEKEAKARQVAGAVKGGKAKAGKVTALGREATSKKRAPTATAAAASTSGVSSRTVERAKMVKERAPQLVEKVRSGELTLKQAEKQIRTKDQLKEIKKYTAPEGKFEVIAADPPWKFNDTLDGSDSMRGGLTYPPMEVKEICAMKLGEKHADKNCILFLWVTNAHLIDGSAADVLYAWGFEPKTMLTWDKVDMANGFWLRGVTEHCILAVRGKPKVTLTNQTTLISEKRRRDHSRKPEAFYELVESLCPGKTRLELFARAERDGWTAAGAEVGKFKKGAA